MDTVAESTDTRLPAGLAYRAVNKIDGITYYSERLTNVQAKAVLLRLNVGLIRIESARPKNGLLNGEVDELAWETV